MPANILTQSGVGSSRVYAADYFQNPVNIGVQAVVTGTVTYTVEYTLDDITSATFNAATATWTAASGSLSGATASANGLIDIPCRGVQVTVTAGDGSVAVTLCQAGIG